LVSPPAGTSMRRCSRCSPRSSAGSPHPDCRAYEQHRS
jgi:hypothetical protein